MRHLPTLLILLLSLTLVRHSAAQVRDQLLKPAESDLNFNLQSDFLQSSGRFTKYSGSIRPGINDFTQSVISFQIDPILAEFNSGAMLMQALLQQMPSQPVHFKSNALHAIGAGRYRVDGTLTSRGKTHRVAFPITMLRSASGETVIKGEIASSELDLPLPAAFQQQALSGTLIYKLVFR